MTYRVMASHCGDPAEFASSFDAVSDEEALKHFERHYVYNPSYGMDYVTLFRVDVVEKTTYLTGENGGKEP